MKSYHEDSFWRTASLAQRVRGVWFFYFAGAWQAMSFGLNGAAHNGAEDTFLMSLNAVFFLHALVTIGVIEKKSSRLRTDKRINTALDRALAIVAARQERRSDATLPGAQMLRRYVQFEGEAPNSEGYLPLVTLNPDDMSTSQAKIIDNYLDSAEEIVRIQRESNEALDEDIVATDDLLSSSAMSVAAMLQIDVESRALLEAQPRAHTA